jgi:hypothetical protein
MLMMKKPKDLEFEPVHPKNVLLASVVHGIPCLCLCLIWGKKTQGILEKEYFSW